MAGVTWQSDPEREVTTVTKVEAIDTGWSIKRADGWSLWVTNEQCAVAPKPGETMLCFGRGFGFGVRGVVIGGRVYRYLTAEQDEKRWKDEVDASRRKRADDYEAKRSDFDARVRALPEPLRVRVERFRALGGDEWRHEFEPYELFCCEQAAALNADIADIRSWSRLSYAAQKSAWSRLDDGHSGNTIGATVRLALTLREQPELVAKTHGALCPLVGCEAYGCWAANEGKAEAS